ncbi:glycosyltransferase involved in cell wall biogenesis [Streptococcus pneumoniae]|nr:glycosyltransferase involved in cell wall biogenesis [Streptococcus pneumoniae]
MKLLSIAISSYNAAAYLHYCVESLVIGGEQVGILIINDGSQDQTQEIAECLASKYPNIVPRWQIETEAPCLLVKVLQRLDFMVK